jgi:drug/metabolite transporter (DMT)-like permease
MLLLVASGTGLNKRGASGRSGSWLSAAALFLYAITFSYSYVSLSTGTGALLLFGFVQITMMVAALASGERPHALQWVGIALALAGIVYLVSPGLAAPSLAGASLMAVSGIAWGVYSILGRGATDPLANTTTNFVRSLPMTAALSVFTLGGVHLQPRGVLLAAVSGAVTSGLGYVVWYAALRRLTAVRGAIVQLPVPVLAATGGVLFLGEAVSLRLVAAAALVLSGIGLALLGRERLA